MRIAIVGCGAIGTVLGAYLNKNGCPVDMVDSYAAHVNAMNERGAKVVGRVEFTVPVRALLPSQLEGIYDVVFLMTKQTANDAVFAELLPHLGPNSTVCTLQNGVPEPYVADHIGPERTVGGAVMWSATFIEPGVSALTQDISNIDYLFDVGEMDGSRTERIETIAGILSKMGRPTHVTGELMGSRWGKLIYNACVSGMSAVCGYTFGQVVDDPVSCACASFIGREVVRCARAEGLTLPTLALGYTTDSFALEDQAMFDFNRKLFRDIYDVARPAKASMLQDLEKGKGTEVTMINGFVSLTGRRHAIPTPFNDKVVEIVTRIERGELTPSPENLKLFPAEWFVYALEQG